MIASTHISPLIVSYRGPSPDDELLSWVAEGHVSGVVIFRDNAPDDETLRDACRTLHDAGTGPFLIMVDEEGGRVRRLPDAQSSMRDLRAYESDELDSLRDACVAVAHRLKNIGINVLLAPVVDIGGSNTDWLNSRTYSDSPEPIAAMARAVIPAIQNAGVMACAKHFPGLHGVAIDPHTDRAIARTLPSDWDTHDAVPFRAAVTSGVQSIMIGHQIMMGFDAVNPACLSPIIVSVLLRQRLGFTGLVLSDDLAMGAITRYFDIERAVSLALQAGCDRAIICNDRDLQRRAVQYWSRERAHTV